MSLIIIPGQENEDESVGWWQLNGIVDVDAFRGSNISPVIITAQNSKSERAEWVLKPLERLGEVGSLRELIGYRFARAVGIPVIESGIVEVSERMISASPRLFNLFNQSVGPNFASRYLPGLIDLMHADEVTRSQQGTATEIYAWDVLVDNVDRRLQRSNIVMDNERIMAIDHELTFSWFGAIGSPGPVWVVSTLHRLVQEHIFSKHVGKWNLRLDDFKQRLTALAPSSIVSLTEDVPKRWMQGEGVKFLQEVRMYLDDVRSRADSIVDLIEGGRSR